MCLTSQFLSIWSWLINLPIFCDKLTEPVSTRTSEPSTNLSATNLKSPCVENPFVKTLTLWTSPENVFKFLRVIFANDCKITSLAEPVASGSKSMVNDVSSCGTAIKGLLSSFSGVSSLIIKGASNSIKSGLWTAKIEAVNEALWKFCPSTPSTNGLIFGSALNVPPANSNLNGSPPCLSINVDFETLSFLLLFVCAGNDFCFGVELIGGISGIGDGVGSACGKWNSSYFSDTIFVSNAVVSDAFCWFFDLAA